MSTERPDEVKLAQKGAEEGWYQDRMEDLWPPVFAYLDALEARNAKLEAAREVSRRVVSGWKLDDPDLWETVEEFEAAYAALEEPHA